MKQISVLPPEPPLSSAEQCIQYNVQPYAFLEACAERFGDAFTLDLGAWGRFVMLREPEAIRTVFTAGPDVLWASGGNAILRPFLGEHSLLLLDGTRHQRHRRLLLPAFHGPRLEGWYARIARVADEIVAGWAPGDELAVHGPMQDFSLNVITRVVFGETPSAKAAALVEALRDFLNTPSFDLVMMGRLGEDHGPLWMAQRARYAAIRALLRTEIDARRADGTDGDDVLSTLIEARDEEGRPLADAELEDELITLVVTGFETTATALAWAFCLLSDHAEVFARTREAIEHGGGDPQKAVADPWLDAVCRETLRLRPVIPIVARTAQRPFAIGPWQIPAGVTVSPAIWLAHRRPAAWPDPEVFRPERFLERKPTPFEYLPFGGSERRCIGANLALVEMKIALAIVLSRFGLSAVDGPPRPVRRTVTVAPADGARVRLTARCSSLRPN